MKPKYCNIYENCNVYENGRINCPFCDNYKYCCDLYNDLLYYDYVKFCELYSNLPENLLQMAEEADLLIL